MLPMWPGKPHHNASSEHRSATTVDGPKKSPREEEVQREVKNLQESEDTPECTLFSLNSQEGKKPFEVELKLDGTPLRREV